VVTSIVVKPIKVLENASMKLASGELGAALPEKYINKADEIGNLSRAFGNVAQNMKAIINDISAILTEMSDKNLEVKTNCEYIGDFLPIKNSLTNIIDSYNAMLLNFGDVARQVASGSEQLSDISQELAQGSTEQESSVSELSNSIENVSADAMRNAENVRLAADYVNDASSGVTKCNEDMRHMLSAMHDIQSASVEISKIISIIESISFQTNILALNAAVEAARAGEAGKGFAVVADEVRNLASRSAEAAKQTTELIERSNRAVERGRSTVEVTADSLPAVIAKEQLVSDTISEIEKTSSGQAAAISEIMQNVRQISVVIQNNAATAEKSAAASEELSGQAEILRDELSAFRLAGDECSNFESAAFESAAG
jgi:methyl-accepting chemotaxis protein